MGRVFVGTDVVNVREIEDALKAFGDRYLSRIYTPAEIAYARAAPSEMARRLGARFAAKEATIKALRASEIGVDPRLIEVTRTTGGACEIALSGVARDAARRAGVASLALSMSHEGEIAMAVVVAERAPSPKSRIRIYRGARQR